MFKQQQIRREQEVFSVPKRCLLSRTKSSQGTVCTIPKPFHLRSENRVRQKSQSLINSPKKTQFTDFQPHTLSFQQREAVWKMLAQGSEGSSTIADISTNISIDSSYFS